jgi:hypothetical protein
MRVVAAVIFGRMANGRCLLFFVLVVLFVVVRV